ncbi:MAG: hypothetical protein JM58_16380 [Peptococcaceae bacterium BICA1-8]|nr:MAG: hypothetical protein JM58_16380 [Peptococcaceae bacterium BICA1-8]
MADFIQTEVCEIKHGQLKDQIRVLFKKTDVIEQISNTLTELKVISQNQRDQDKKRDQTIADFATSMKEIASILSGLQGQINNTNEKVDEVRKDVIILKEDNTVKVTIIIKNAIFAAAGVAVGVAVTYLITGGF